MSEGFNIGDFVFDKTLNRSGLIIDIVESLVPYRVYYSDGKIDICCAHDIEVLNGVHFL